MEKQYLDALTYLGSFESGLSHYNWDRAITYKLNYNIHPGEFIRYFIAKKLILNEVPVSNDNYELSPLGRETVEANIEQLKPMLIRIDEAIQAASWGKTGISVNRYPPYYSVNFLDHRIVIWIKRSNESTEIVCSFPAETTCKVNTIYLTLEMLNKTNLLADLLKIHFDYIVLINARSMGIVQDDIIDNGPPLT